MHGEWHLWVYGSDWQLAGPEGVTRYHEDYDRIDRAVERFTGRRLIEARVDPASGRACFRFDGAYELDLAANSDSETADAVWWYLFTPGEMVLVVGPEAEWKYESAHEH